MEQLEKFVLDHSQELKSLDQKDFFSDAYLYLRQRFLFRTQPTSKVYESLTFLNQKNTFTEKHLRAIWYESRYERRGLQLSDGRKISVLFPGEWNTQEGPDFKNAEIEIDHQRFQGDIELHLHSSDWIHHGHHQNPLYGRTLLHVVLFPNKKNQKIYNYAGQSIPELELKNALHSEFESIINELELEDYPYRSNALLGSCGKALGLPSHISPDKLDFLNILLKLSGDSRVLLKGKKDHLFSLKIEDWDCLLYSKIFEALGYSENKNQMRKLALLVPYSFLKQAVHGTMGEQRLHRIQSILFGAAGYLDGDFKQSIHQTVETFQNSFLSEWKLFSSSFSPMHRSEWKLKQVRPMNFPIRRLAGFAHYLNKNLDSGLLAHALSVVDSWKSMDVSENKFFLSCMKDIRLMTICSDPDYFLTHSDFGSKPFSHSSALIGEERSLIIWVNAFLPLVVEWIRLNNLKDMEKKLHQVWKKMPVIQFNRISKIMLTRLLGKASDQFPLNSEQLHQGLIQVFNDFCDTKPSACLNCVFPKAVSLPVYELFRRTE